MNKSIFIFLANGFEESEAICAFDIFKRAKYDVSLVSMEKTLSLTSSHSLIVEGDKYLKEVLSLSPDCVYLPGGMKGAKSLSESEELKRMLLRLDKEGKIISSICASPAIVLGSFGLLLGHKATCYPGCEEYYRSFPFSKEGVVVSGNIITGKSAGWTYDLALEVVKTLSGKEKSEEIKNQICYIHNI